MKLFLAALLIGYPATAFAQDIDPVRVSPDMYKVLLENDNVRVVRYTIEPAQSDSMHTHPPKVSYVLSGGTLRIHIGDTSFVSHEKTGEVTFRGAVPNHYVNNIGTTPVSIVLVEPKKIDAQVVPADQDPFKNNPSTLSVKLETDSVRVMEATIPPGAKENSTLIRRMRCTSSAEEACGCISPMERPET